MRLIIHFSLLNQLAGKNQKHGGVSYQRPDRLSGKNSLPCSLEWIQVASHVAAPDANKPSCLSVHLLDGNGSSVTKKV